MKRGFGAGLVLAALGLLLFAEARLPLRRAREPKPLRDGRNLAMAALSAATLRAVERPLVEPLARQVRQRRLGLLPKLGLPPRLEGLLAILLLDYTLYLWHVLTHRAAFLWRFHLVHHVDLDLSTSTAVRFHFAELALSAPWRAAQVRLIGVRPQPLALWRALTTFSILFHHSNLRLPARLERALVRIVVTPRMHGIHHSDRPEDTDSNWSSGLTLWDRLHGTLNLGRAQQAITIGVPAYRDPRELDLPRLLAMPFGPQRPSWRPTPPHEERKPARTVAR